MTQFSMLLLRWGPNVGKQITSIFLFRSSSFSQDNSQDSALILASHKKQCRNRTDALGAFAPRLES